MTTELLRLRCPDCPYDRTEFDIARLTEHYAIAHMGGIWLYKCPRCQTKFATPYLAAHHMITCWDITAQIHQYTQPLVTYDFSDHQTIKKVVDKAIMDAVDRRVRDEVDRRASGSNSGAQLTHSNISTSEEGFYNLDDQRNNNEYDMYDPMSLDNISPNNSRNVSNWGDRIISNEVVARTSRESLFGDAPERRVSIENYGYVDRSPQIRRFNSPPLNRRTPSPEPEGHRRNDERRRGSPRRRSKSPRARRGVSPRIRRAVSPRVRRIASPPRARRTDEKRRSRDRSRERRIRSPLRKVSRIRRSESRERLRRDDNIRQQQQQYTNGIQPIVYPPRNAPIPSLMDINLSDPHRGPPIEGYTLTQYAPIISQAPADDYLQPSIPIGKGIIKLTGPMSPRNMILYNEKTESTDVMIELDSARGSIMYFNSRVLSDASSYFKSLFESSEFRNNPERKLFLNRPYVPFLDAMNIVHERKVPWKARCKSYFCCWNLHRVYKVMKEAIELDLTCVKAYVHRELFLNRCSILNDVSDCTACIERVALAKYFNLHVPENVKFTPMACLKWISECEERSCAPELNITTEVVHYLKKFLSGLNLPGYSTPAISQQ